MSHLRKPSGRKVRYAVVACGQISQQAFIPGLFQTDNAELAALVTADPVKAEALEKKYHVPAYSYDEYHKILNDEHIDAVYIATPNFAHKQYAVPALEAGLHVLLEKPMATSVNDCKAIIAAQKKMGAKLMIAYRLHCEPTTVELMTQVQHGLIGVPHFFSSVFFQPTVEANHRAQYGYWCGPAPDLGTYPLNAVRNLFMEEPIEVFAKGFKTPERNLSLLDTISVVLHFPRQRQAQFAVSYAFPPVEEFTLVGTNGSVRSSPCFMFGPEKAISYTTKIKGQEKAHAHPPVDQFGGETSYFSKCILEDIWPEPDGEEGLRDVRVLEAIEESLISGQPIKMPLIQAERSKIIRPDQAYTLPPSSPPDKLVNVILQDGGGILE